MKSQIILGFLGWLCLFLLKRPPTNSHDWAILLLLLATLVWLPIALHVLWFRQRAPFSIRRELLRYGVLPSALALSGSTFLVGGWEAGALALPWFGVTLLIFSFGFEKIHSNLWQSSGELAIAAACMFLPVGGFWALADRLDWQPLGFDPAIVLLTAVHFHYAGFLFTLLCGLAERHFPKKALRMACWLAVLAVPMTAVGITIAQLWQNYLLETLAAATVALAGWCCAAGYFHLLFSEKITLAARISWGILSLSLIFSMTLALLYALRPWLPFEWLNIPSMRAWHGTVNALGVAGCGMLGWYNLNAVKP